MALIHRRQLFAAATAASLLPSWARSGTPGLSPTLSGEDLALTIAPSRVRFDGRETVATTINGTVPGPLIRLKEGQNLRVAVTNRLAEDTSIHWHGLILPFQMDGVPGLSFPGIKPGETFVYEFPIRQAGTYWCHSHSGVQELTGLYAPIVIDPAGAEPAPYDREHVIVLSDYSFLPPHTIVERLKQQAGYFNRQKQTLSGLLAGRDQPLADRKAWAAMRMDPTDILDVTGSTYTYLVNGHGPRDNWTGLFRPGERVRLRFVNAGAMTLFNLRIPGLKMTVVQADGQNIEPVEVDALQLANAETYDVIVTPAEDRAYAIAADAADGSGQALGTLAPRLGMRAEAPPILPRPLLGMRDMGMDMSGMGSMEHGHSMAMRDPANAPGVKMGPGVQMISPMPADRTGERGAGLADFPGKVLVYTDLVALEPNPDPRPPSRTLEVHLTGNMERFMWGFDGTSYFEGKQPFAFRLNERARVVLINDSMMNHPIHLHGHFFEVVNGREGRQPRKHTVNVMPGGRVAFDFTADAPGDWAFHCHMLLHMHAGMFNVVTVRPMSDEAAS